MFILYWELCECNKKTSNAQCCCTVIRTIYGPHTLLSVCYCGCCGCATTSSCGCLCLGQCQGKPENSTESKGSKKICKYIGRAILCLIVFVLFMGIFLLRGMTIGVAFHYPTLERSILSLRPSRRSVQADDFGPGFDARQDTAMFISMVYELPNWYHVGLYDNRNVNIANSASVHQIQNRLYIGQLNELEYLKDGTLTKVIPYVKIFPFVDKINHNFFNTMNPADFSNCKLLFRLKYHPTNND